MTDPLAVLDAAYVMEASEQRWLSRLVEAARRCLGDQGTCAWTYDASGPELHAVRTVAGTGVDPRFLAANSAFDANLPDSVRLMISRIYRAGFVGNLVRAPAVLSGQGLDSERTKQFQNLLSAFLDEWKLADALWINAQDPTYVGCLLVAPLRKRRVLNPHEVHRLRCIAAHVVTAFRIRRQLAEWTDAQRGDGRVEPEAVLEPNGKLLHAEGAARGALARSALARAVSSLDRARGTLRRRDPEEALAIWHALVAGRWSLLDHVDSDGRRYVLAHRNDARVPDLRGLTLRERQTLAYAALGHSNKVIAYELGLSTSTVAGHLARARAKTKLGWHIAIAPSPDSIREGSANEGASATSNGERAADSAG